MIRIENLQFGYNNHPVLSNINLEVNKGEIISILGPNGCGKSTLLRLLRGALKPKQGQVLWQGQQAATLSRRAMAKLAAVVPQSIEAPFPYIVQEMVAMGRYASSTSVLATDRQQRRAVEKALALTDTMHLADRVVTDLSGGELQRVILARALAQEAPVLLLDEASNNLDLEHRLDFADLLLRLNRDLGITVIQISHDLDQAAEISHRILLLDSTGTIVALGKPGEVFTSENLRKTFQVETQIETNPYSGAPQVYTIRHKVNRRRELPRIHIICGGGSGGALLRQLNFAGADISVGPLNRGDSDQLLAEALELETIIEKPFSPISSTCLSQAKGLSRSSDVLIVTPTVWGPGNLPCLELVMEVQKENIPVWLISPEQRQDFTGGKAWQLLEEIQTSGAQLLPDLNAALEALKKPLETVS